MENIMNNLQNENIREKLKLDNEQLLIVKKTEFFDSFFNIFSIVQDKINEKYPTFDLRVGKKRLLKQHMDQFLHLKNEQLIFELLDNGYCFTSKQLKTYNQYIFDQINSYNRYDILEKTLEYNIKLEEKVHLKLFKECLGFQEHNGRYKGGASYNIIIFNSLFNQDYVIKGIHGGKHQAFPLLTESMRTYVISGICFKNELDNIFNELETKLKDKKNRYDQFKGTDNLNYLLTGNYREYFHPYLDYKRLNKLAKNFEKSSSYLKDDKENFKEFLNRLLTINFKNNSHVLKIETKKEFKENYIKNHPTHKIIQNNMVTKQLPAEAVILLDKTEEIYFSFTEEFKTLDFECKNLFEKKIPQILEQYLSIDENLRKSLIHINEKNAETLLLESLCNIYNHIDKKWKDINEEKLNNLNVSVRYTNNFKV